jgi:hypothetical protein
MANPTGALWRGYFANSILGRLWQDVAWALSAVNANEAAYTAEHYATITEALDSARDSIESAVNASSADSTP